MASPESRIQKAFESHGLKSLKVCERHPPVWGASCMTRDGVFLLLHIHRHNHIWDCCHEKGRVLHLVGIKQQKRIDLNAIL